MYKALKRLNQVRRNIILMVYWLEMNDREIGEAIGYSRSNVNRIKLLAQEKLQIYMEGYGYGRSEGQ